jgi:MerR family transcriptional regulator, redox-sensitive transcriptional activator SoxR
MTNAGGLTIGDVAARAGLRPSAIRYYERAGLLTPPNRAAGRRVYDESVFELLALIKLAQDAGFTVAETRMVMHGFERATPPSQRWRSMAQQKLDEIAVRLERAERMRDVLQRLMRCECRTLGECARSRRAAMETAARKHPHDRARA